MVVSVLPIAVKPGSEDDLARAFAELDVFEHARRSGGFLGGRLLRPLTAGEPVVVIAEWESPDAYRGWLDNPMRDELAAALEPLLAGHIERGGLYEEV